MPSGTAQAYSSAPENRRPANSNIAMTSASTSCVGTMISVRSKVSLTAGRKLTSVTIVLSDCVLKAPALV